MNATNELRQVIVDAKEVGRSKTGGNAESARQCRNTLPTSLRFFMDAQSRTTASELNLYL